MLLTVAGAAMLLAGCSSLNGGRWPTLAPRPGEISPLVPRTPLGACAGCGQDVFPAQAQAAQPVAAVPRQAPADSVARLDAVETAITAVETSLAAQNAVVNRAVASAAAAPGNDDLGVTAEVERSRLQLMYVALVAQDEVLDGLADDLDGVADAAALRARLAMLRARIVALRDGSPAG